MMDCVYFLLYLALGKLSVMLLITTYFIEFGVRRMPIYGQILLANNRTSSLIAIDLNLFKQYYMQLH